MTYSVKEVASILYAAVEIVLLFLIWVDGRAIRKIEAASHNLYIKYFEERREERTKKLKQLADARAAKANKAEKKTENIKTDETVGS